MNGNRGLVLVAALAFVGGCKGGSEMNPPPPDLSMMQQQMHDMAMPINNGDMAAPPTMCQPDPMMDGQKCGNGCPLNSGTVPVGDGNGGCNCWYTCTPMTPNSCPCGRTCAPLYMQTDAGQVPAGGACLHANGAAERCGFDQNNKPIFAYGACQDGTVCVNEDQGGKFAFCMYKCTKGSDCPAGTTCLMLQGGGSVCAINTTENNPKALGAACAKDDLCAVDTACDGVTCKQACNGVMDNTTCMNGAKCTAVVDANNNNKISAYVCK